MPAALMTHDFDPKQDALDKVGSVDDYEVTHNQVLVAIYLRPPMTRGGVIIPDSMRDEDKIQGKVGLIIKMGSQAYDEEYQKKYGNMTMSLHDWIVFRPSDGWAVTLVNAKGEKVACRMLDDVDTRMRIRHPDQIW